MKNYQAAEQDFRFAIKYSHRWAQAYYNSGRARYAIGEYKKATKRFDKAIKINREYVDAYYYRSKSRFARKKYEDAIEDCDRVIARNPSYAAAYEIKGESLLALNKPIGAKQAFEKAAQIYAQKEDKQGLQRVQKITAEL